MHVFLAEDDRAVRDALVRALTLEGYSVTAVSNGAQALEGLNDLAASGERPVDVVLLDVSMPVVDGLTVCRVLRSEGNRVPILMLTARTEVRDRVAGLDAGADDYLPKPFDLDELFARLRALVRRTVLDATDAPAAGPGEMLTLGDLEIHTAGRRVTRGGVEQGDDPLDRVPLLRPGAEARTRGRVVEVDVHLETLGAGFHRGPAQLGVVGREAHQQYRTPSHLQSIHHPLRLSVSASHSQPSAFCRARLPGGGPNARTSPKPSPDCRA